MSRKLLAPLAIVAALAMAACGGSPPEDAAAPPADAAPTDTMAPADPAAAPAADPAAPATTTP